MNNFEYYNPTELIFGKNTEQKVGEAVKFYGGQKVLIVYGGKSAVKSGVLDRVKQSLKKENIEYEELGGVVPNPRFSLAKKGADIVKEKGLDFVLAVGGGSTIDTAKCIALQAVYDGDVWEDLYKKRMPAKRALPVGSVLTIAAAGSESSDVSVITNDEDFFKLGYSNRNIIPRFAVLNPELLYTVPKYQQGCGISDILAHLMERYFTNVSSVDVTDRMLEAVMKTVIHYAPRVIQDPTDYDAQAEIMFAGTLAHNGLLNLGRIGDWGTHRIEHQLSLFYDIAHGAGLSILYPAWMKFCYKVNPLRFAQFFQNVFRVEYSLTDTDLIIKEGIKKLEEFYTSIGVPTRMSQVGIDSSKFKQMANKAVTAHPIGNFYRFSEDDIVSLFELAL